MSDCGTVGWPGAFGFAAFCLSAAAIVWAVFWAIIAEQRNRIAAGRRALSEGGEER